MKRNKTKPNEEITLSGKKWFVHTFTSSGTFTPSKTLTCDILVVGGGGGGGGGLDGNGANGGSGIVIIRYQEVKATSGAFFAFF